MLLRLTTVPDNATDDRISILVPTSGIHFIHGAMPAASEGEPGPREACTGVYMLQNGKPLFVSETLADILEQVPA